MIYFLLPCVHDRIDVYHAHITYCPYPALYHILSQSYLDHQMNPKCE